MSHEAVIYGVIVGTTLHVSAGYRTLQTLNEKIIRSLPTDDHHPSVDVSIFALPGPQLVGTYRSQLIHFGLTLSENTSPIFTDDGQYWDWHYVWIGKFEAVLKQLYWTSARVILESDFNPRRREFTWKPTDEALQRMYDEPYAPIAAWDRVMRVLEGEKLFGT